MQTYCDHSVTTQACTSIERNRVLYEYANWLRESRYDKQSSWRSFETWQRSFDVTVMKWIYCHYVIRMIYSVIRTRAFVPAYFIPRMRRNQIVPISLQWRDVSDTAVCSCASAAWQQRNTKASLTVLFLGVSTMTDGISSQRASDAEMFPCHDVIIRTYKDIQRIPLFHDLTLNNDNWFILPIWILVMIIDEIHIFA